MRDEQENIDKKMKTRRKFKELPIKRRTILMTLILSTISGVICLAFSIVMHFTIIEANKTGLLLLPGNFIAEIMLLWVLIYIGFFLLLPLFPYLAKLYIYIHKLVTFFQFEYSLVQTSEEQYTFKRIFKKILSPFLFSFIIGYWTGTWIFIPILNLTTDTGLSTLVYFLGAMIFMPIVVLLINPLWLLNDSGIIAMKKRKEGDRTIPDIEGPSVYFFSFFTGSTYTLAVITLIDFFIYVFKDQFEATVFFAFLFIILFLIPSQILVIMYLYENFFVKLKRKLLRILPNKLVDKIPKTIFDITAFDPFYVPDSIDLTDDNDTSVSKEPSDFNIETEIP